MIPDLASILYKTKLNLSKHRKIGKVIYKHNRKIEQVILEIKNKIIYNKLQIINTIINQIRDMIKPLNFRLANLWFHSINDLPKFLTSKCQVLKILNNSLK